MDGTLGSLPSQLKMTTVTSPLSFDSKINKRYLEIGHDRLLHYGIDQALQLSFAEKLRHFLKKDRFNHDHQW